MANAHRPILRVALPVPLRQCFDYLAPAGAGDTLFRPGIRIRVPFGRRQRVGILLETAADTEIARTRLKTATEVIDQEPLFTPGQLALLLWAAGYYQHPVGEVLFNALPPALRTGKAATLEHERGWRLTAAGTTLDPETLTRAPKQGLLIRTLADSGTGMPEKELRSRFGDVRKPLQVLLAKGLVEEFEAGPGASRRELEVMALNPAQRDAAQEVGAALSCFRPYLLYGVTGSGKTEVYLEVIREVVAAGRQALLLVPEIGLTPQLIGRVRRRLDCGLAVIHSGLSDSERSAAWLQARAGAVQVVLGTRSAVWTPLRSPGVIVVDEEHDSSYKQQDGFRYSARDSAVMRARNENIPVILGSATPSMESLHNVHTGRFTQLRLPDRAGSAAHPEVQIIDLRARPLTGALSESLLDAVQQTLDNGGQSLLFLNRRGFSPVIMCHGCGWIASCSRCEVPMTYHRPRDSLLCHHCGRSAAAPHQCPECGAPNLFRIGHGTQRIEETLAQRFDSARILRIDRDSTRRKGAMDDMVGRINAGEADILIGTQMLAKGHDFPNLELVGIVDADRGLFSADFRATERMAQLFIQVSGRAGRSARRGRVVLQTHFPAHPLLQSLIRTGYDGFAEAVLEERKLADLPPFSYLALLRAEHYQADRPRLFLEQARDVLINQNSGVMVMGPVPAPMEKRAGRTRFQLLVQARRRPALAGALGPWMRELDKLPSGKRVRWSLDVDPQDLL